MDINFIIENQKLTKINTPFLVNKSNKYLNLYFEFTTPDWQETTRFAILKNETGNNYLFEITDTGVNIPYDVVEGKKFIINVYGVKNDDTRITTNNVGIYLKPSGYTTDISNIEDLTPTIVEDIYLKINRKLNIADVEDHFDINSANPVQNKIVLNALNGKSNNGHHHVVNDIDDFPNLSNVATSGDYNDLLNKPTIISLGGDVTFEQQSTADPGYFATYILKQGGQAVGDKLQIPEDFLLKSVDIKVCTVDGVPLPDYKVGDYYFDFVFNTKDGSVTDEHKYLKANVLKDVYTADNITLQLLNGVFSVKNKGISTAQLSNDINTKLGYAENYNASPAKNITNNDISAWNSKQTTQNLVTGWSDVLSDTKYPSEKLVKNTIDDRIGDIVDFIVNGADNND